MVKTPTHQKLIRSLFMIFGLTSLSACSTYGDPAVYADLSCEGLRQQLAPANQDLSNLVQRDDSDAARSKSGKFQISNPDLARNQIEKRNSDLRAAYRKNGC